MYVRYRMEKEEEEEKKRKREKKIDIYFILAEKVE